VAGLGFAAVRDAAAWVKYVPEAAVSAKYTFAFGVSQTGRWLREFLYEGFNTDESNRQVFDTVWPHRGCAAGGQAAEPLATASTGQLAANPFEPKVVLRALLGSMEKWVEDGTAPPPSRYPRLKDHTLVAARNVAWPKIPGVTSPQAAYAGVRGPNRLLPRDGAGAPLPYLVPQVDRDGNPVGGLRLPDVAVPLATYTGWNFRSNAIGGTEQFFPLLGG